MIQSNISNERLIYSTNSRHHVAQETKSLARVIYHILTAAAFGMQMKTFTSTHLFS